MAWALALFSALEVFYENALYKFTFDIGIDIDIIYYVNHHVDWQ